MNPLVFSAPIWLVPAQEEKKKEQKRVPFFASSMGMDERGDAASDDFSVRERKRKKGSGSRFFPPSRWAVIDAHMHLIWSRAYVVALLLLLLVSLGLLVS